MSRRRLLRWIDDTGYRTNITPVISSVNKKSDGTVASPTPTIARLGTTNFFYFDHDFTEDVIFVADSGDAGMVPQIRYRDGIAGPNDDKTTILQSPSGTYQIQVITQSAGAVRVPGVSVSVINGSGTVIGYIDRTDSNGEATITLDAAAGIIFRGYKAGYTIPDVIATISGGQTVTVTATTISVGVQAGYQTITYVPTAGAYDATNPIYAKISKINQSIGSSVLTDRRIVAVDAGSFMALTLPKGGKYTIYGKSANSSYALANITVTTEDTKQLSDYLAA